MKTLVWKILSENEKSGALTRPAVSGRGDLSGQVAEILSQVKQRGDEALKSLTSRLDKVTLTQFEVSSAEAAEGRQKVSQEARTAMKRAAANIETFHRSQLPVNYSVEVSPGILCERHSRPISRIGLYAPGGSASLPSTVLMLGIPSRLAGCSLRVLCTPPRKDGTVDPHILEAAAISGIEKVFKLGGAQAIGALAFGTATVPKVDKIFGPGNAWVTEAKEQVARCGTAIDLPAGPSEVLVIADATANAVFVAADLLSQAEHGCDSQVVLITDSLALIEEVKKSLVRQLADLPRAAIAAEALEKSLFIIVDSLAEAFEVSNAYAPEHLILQVENAANYKEKIENAGSVFLGPWSPESAGDYASGTNHVLPTYGHARTLSGLPVDSFLKQITFQQISAAGLRDLGPTIETLAGIELLDAHRRAVSVRLDYLRLKNEVLR